MNVRYYRLNRAAYTTKELVTITRGRRRLLLPLLLLRLWILKLLGIRVPVGDPIADQYVRAPLTDSEAQQVCRRFDFFQSVQAGLSQVHFNARFHSRVEDPQYPYESYSLHGVDNSGSIGVVCTIMVKDGVPHNWVDFYSVMVDGHSLRTNNHPLAGVLRALPSAIVQRQPCASLPELLSFHRQEMARLTSEGACFKAAISLQQMVQVDQEYYSDQIAHWVATGLLVPDPGTA